MTTRDHRYLRASRVIERAINETGEPPTIARLAREGDMCEHVASYCLQAWDSYYEAIVRMAIVRLTSGKPVAR